MPDFRELHMLGEEKRLINLGHIQLKSWTYLWSQNSGIIKIGELRNIGFEVASETEEQESSFSHQILLFGSVQYQIMPMEEKY